MMKSGNLHEVVLPMDRWSARVVSPFNLSKGIDTDKYGSAVMVHPGWAKAPERHRKLLFKLAESGFFPIGVDTRYAYADRRQPRIGRISHAMLVGTQNAYFEIERAADNRWQYRRPTVLLEICKRLEIQKRSYVGHSEGGRISALAAAAYPDEVGKLVIINGAGMGDSTRGGARLVKANSNRIRELIIDKSEIREATKSAIGSTAYALTHIRRTAAEKRVIQGTDTWLTIDLLRDSDVRVEVFHAVGDELISYEDSAENASNRPWLSFTPTQGGHSNVYELAIQDQVVAALSK